jgi:ABC-2 type transport system ATP-binding protein
LDLRQEAPTAHGVSREEEGILPFRGSRPAISVHSLLALSSTNANTITFDRMTSSSATPALRVAGLRKAYGDVVAVDGLDLAVARGECFGLLGPNGAGKTTTIEICEGLTEPDAGVVEVLGRQWNSDERALRERLGIQLQETQLSDKLTVNETVTLFRSFYERGRGVDEVIDVVQLGEKREARVGKLSGGQKQRLALACAIVGDPELLFLDEPTTGLDPQSRRQLWDLIVELRASGRSIVLTTHYMDEAEKLCDRVAIVDHGHVIALGTPRELIAGLGAEHVVEFTTVDAPPAALDVESLQQLNGVRAAREHDGRWTLEVVGLARAVPALLAELSRRGLTLGELATHSATLEDVFVSLTGRQLRDA